MTAEFSVAVHALVYLVHRDCLVSSEVLADNICTNPARVRKVMTKLHHAGLVDAERGKGSGYRCTARTEKATLKQIMLALGEEPVSISWRSGDIDRDCQVSSGMGAVMDGVYEKLNGACFDWLDTVTVESIVGTLFQDKQVK